MDDSTHKRDDLFELYGFRILRSLRRIMHAVDSHSRKLNNEYRITSPQMLCLYSLVREDISTQAELVRHVALGASTVNGIVDRLEEKDLVIRERGKKDRRKVHLQVTEAGRALTVTAPSLLQSHFSATLRELPDLEQATIALSLERVVKLMQTQPTEP